MTTVAPWVAPDIDPDRVVAELRRRFPGVCAWWGEFTGTWWALIRDRTGQDRLIEAPSPAELGRRLEDLSGRMVPRFTRAAVRTGTASRSTPPPAEVSRVAVPPKPCTGAVHGRHQVPRRRSWGRPLLAALVVLVGAQHS